MVAGKERRQRRRIHYGDCNSKSLLSKCNGFLASICGVLRKFSAYTSFHGFIYIAKNDLAIAKKLFWIIVLINVFVMCAFQTWSLVGFWNEANMLVTKESASIKVWNIPFPAVTVCSENQIDKSRLNAAKKELAAHESYKNLENLVNILCDTPTGDNYTRDETIDDNTLKYLFTKLALPCEKVISRVFWMQNELSNPCQYIQPIILSTGVCYSFNMIPHQDLFAKQYADVFENILSYKKKMKGLPWRVAGDTMFNSVTMSLNLNYFNYQQYCEITGDGLKIFVHNPNVHPLLSTNLFVTGGSSNLLLITPKSVTTSDSLIKWHTVSRGCFYQKEKVLRYFKIYTQSNCQLECHINKITERCGCTPFYLPQSKDIAVCGWTKGECIKDAVSTKFSIFDAQSNVFDEEQLQNHNCGCLPSCSELTYNTDISQTATNWTYVQNIIVSNMTKQFKNIALVTLHFKSKSVDNWVRSPVIRFNELIANVGGIISLYLGCSIISFFEVICFVVMKKWHQHLSDTQNNKSLDAKTTNNKNTCTIVFTTNATLDNIALAMENRQGRCQRVKQHDHGLIFIN